MSDDRAVAGQAWGEASSLVDEAEYPLLLLGSMSHLRPHQKQARRLHGLVVARQRGVRDVIIPSKQVKSGSEAGSWSPSHDEWGQGRGGRLFMTCFCTFMLEVYYRHMPLYGLRIE